MEIWGKEKIKVLLLTRLLGRNFNSELMVLLLNPRIGRFPDFFIKNELDYRFLHSSKYLKGIFLKIRIF